MKLSTNKLKSKTFEKITIILNVKIFRYIFYLFTLAPFINKKYRNVILNIIEYKNRRKKLNSLPYQATLNISNLCNKRCKFCEIHYFYWKSQQISKRIFPNSLSIYFIKRFEELFKNITHIELTGATGEPFINKQFLDISDYLTNKLGIICSATTNGSLITEADAKKLVKTNFGHLLFSIHGANREIYKDLQGGDLEKIFKVIERINYYKNKLNSEQPIIGVNFLLSRINTSGIFNFMKKLKKLNVNFLQINHYYDSRNRLPKEISYYFDKRAGNKIIKSIYNYAKKIRLTLKPVEPVYFDSENSDKKILNCPAPFNTIKFKGCVEYENSNYVSVCNRITLFRLNYKEFFESNGEFNEIWNHELLQYFRSTVGKNPICKFCLAPETPKIRCTNNAEYSIKRDNSIKRFFKEFYLTHPNLKEIKGLYLLHSNPYQYQKDDKF